MFWKSSAQQPTAVTHEQRMREDASALSSVASDKNTSYPAWRERANRLRSVMAQSQQ